MKKTAILFLLIILTSVIPAQEKRMTHGDDRKPEKARPVDVLESKLRQLDRIYNSKLRGSDFRKAEALLDEMYNLIHEIKVQLAPPVYDPVIIHEDEFMNLYGAVKNEAFESNQLNILDLSAGYGFFSVDQLIRLTKLFAFSSGKIAAVRIVFPRVADKYNSYKLLEAFPFSSDKEEVERIIKGTDTPSPGYAPRQK